MPRFRYSTLPGISARSNKLVLVKEVLSYDPLSLDTRENVSRARNVIASPETDSVVVREGHKWKESGDARRCQRLFVFNIR